MCYIRNNTVVTLSLTTANFSGLYSTSSISLNYVGIKEEITIRIEKAERIPDRRTCTIGKKNIFYFKY